MNGMHRKLVSVKPAQRVDVSLRKNLPKMPAGKREQALLQRQGANCNRVGSLYTATSYLILMGYVAIPSPTGSLALASGTCAAERVRFYCIGSIQAPSSDSA